MLNENFQKMSRSQSSQMSKSPRTQLRTGALKKGEMGSPRPSSARVKPTREREDIYMNKARSNSARIAKVDVRAENDETIEDIDAEEHKAGCPWRKGRSRSKYRLNLAESSSGILHPKPWGARNPNDIPCFCRLSRGVRESSRGPAGRSPTRLQDFLTRHERQASRNKVEEVVAALCAILDRKKLTFSDAEFNMLVEKVREKLHKYKDQSVDAKELPKPKLKQQRQQPQEEKKSPVRRPRTMQSLSPVPQSGYSALGRVSKENMADQAKSGVPLVSKLERNKYWIELRSADQVPAELKQVIGLMNGERCEKQVVLMEDKMHHYGGPEELRECTVLNAGVQLRHHAENTTLLLANQGLPRVKEFSGGRGQLLPSHIGLNPRRI